MARLGLISDLHATLPALDAVLADLDARGVERVVCLGDIVDMGPQPAQVIDRLRERGIPCIGGNHDTLDERPGFPLLRAVEDWTRAQLSGEQRAWLDALPSERVERLGPWTVLCVHGSPAGVCDQVLATTPWTQLEAWWGDRDFDVMVCGHTHVQTARREGAKLVVNVGSVAQPFARPFVPGPGAAPPSVLKACDYAILEASPAGVSAQLMRVPLPWEAFEASLRASDFPQPDVWLQQWRR